MFIGSEAVNHLVTRPCHKGKSVVYYRDCLELTPCRIPYPNWQIRSVCP